MPLFSFACKTCETSFETLVRSDETPVCPSCGAVKLEKLLARIAKPAPGGPADSAPAAACNGEGPGACAACPAMSDAA